MELSTEIAQLERERAGLRRSLQRSTAVAVVVFVLAVTLAVAAVMAGAKAKRTQEVAKENLWNALAAEADLAVQVIAGLPQVLKGTLA